jgi:triacylglycerol lipase
MIAFWLRWLLATETIIFVAAGALLERFNVLNLAVEAGGALGIFILANSWAILLSFAMSNRARRASAGTGRRRPPLLATIVGECLAYAALFLLIQPFERLWMGDDRMGRQAPGSTPLLLIHGYLCNRGAWWWLRRRLKAAGFHVATLNLEPPLGSIEGFADQLHTRIEALRAETGAERVVLVGHSMGGLVARAYLARHGADRVAKLVTLACPHHGTWLARHGLGKDARQMETDSGWIHALPTPDLPMLNIWSLADNFVAPQNSSRLAGANEILLTDTGHLAMLFSPFISDSLVRELAPLHPAVVP